MKMIETLKIWKIHENQIKNLEKSKIARVQGFEY